MMRRIRSLLWEAAVIATGRRRRRTILAELQRDQWASREENARRQSRSLAALLDHAGRHVPYYRDALREAGVLGPKGVDLTRFADIPLLDKQTLRERNSELRSDDLAGRDWYGNSSGGSTGEPVTFIQEESYRDRVAAIKTLEDQWLSLRLGDRRAILWGSERDLFVGRESARARIRSRLRNELWMNAFRMDAARMREHLERFNRFRPRLLHGYAESIHELARFAEREKLPVHRPAAVVSAAGTLHAHMRETMERVFGAPVFNRYGSREAGSIAGECEAHEGLHLFVPHVHVEILRPDGSPAPAGEVGELVVTVLSNFAMPLIRYRIGDMAAWAGRDCSCGRGWPLLESVAGRVTDVFVRPDGGVVVPEYLIHLVGVVLNRGWVRRYQVVQESIDRVVVRIVVEPGTDDPAAKWSDEIGAIAEKIRLVMGEECRVSCEFVDEIPPTESGKYRYTISRVARAAS